MKIKKTILPIIIFLILLVTAYSDVSARENTYRIGPGDVIEISVWKDESLSRQLVVPPDGVIAFPLIGDIDVTELTVAETREIVSKRLKEYVTDAEVTVMLLNANSLIAYVVGKVNTPGQFPINMETSVMQILAMAGDLNEFASAGNILILRQQDGIVKKIPFDYDEVKKGKKLEQNIFLKRGDVVVVP
ncbi:MAG: polysaccharide biosynthesis/export family protein [Deltaproteobacteria bacterium]|nr:polysaccharide biosynthesis/export family protein [Deltaproteobacteria bacterium]